MLKDEIIYDHYKDSFSIQQGYMAKRDRLTIYILLCFVAFAFVITNPDTLSKIINSYICKALSLKEGVFDFAIVNTGIIYLLLWFILQYYQICLTIEGQYKYIHNLELKLDNVGREGVDYEYYSLKKVANFIYTWLIPVGIIIASSIRCVFEYKSFNTNVIVDLIGLVIIILISILYFSDRNLCWVYFDKEYKKIGLWKRILGFLKIKDFTETN